MRGIVGHSGDSLEEKILSIGRYCQSHGRQSRGDNTLYWEVQSVTSEASLEDTILLFGRYVLKLRRPPRGYNTVYLGGSYLTMTSKKE